MVIPSGAVLNCCLRALGHDVGASNMGEASARTVEAAYGVLSGANQDRILLPELLVIARKADGAFTEHALVKVGEIIGHDYSIVDFIMSTAQLAALERQGLRALVCWLLVPLAWYQVVLLWQANVVWRRSAKQIRVAF